jgi:hypothetical protein
MTKLGLGQLGRRIGECITGEHRREREEQAAPQSCQNFVSSWPPADLQQARPPQLPTADAAGVFYPHHTPVPAWQPAAPPDMLSWSELVEQLGVPPPRLPLAYTWSRYPQPHSYLQQPVPQGPLQPPSQPFPPADAGNNARAPWYPGPP